MAEKGPVIRRGYVTNSITPIGTFASSTGLPPESFTTSFSPSNTTSPGILDGHDQQSYFSGLKNGIYNLANTSLINPGAAIPSYFDLGIVEGGHGGAPVTIVPPPVLTNNIIGNSLPTPTTSTRYYKMVGFYTTGAVYESFVVANNPTSSSTTNPNTGHALVNTYVAQVWTI